MRARWLVVLLLGTVVHCARVPCAMAGDLETLEQVANLSIDSLGKPDGYFGNPEARIPLPGKLEKVRKLLQTVGASKEVDALVLGMNRAAEAALPESRAMIAAAIRSMPPLQVASPAADEGALTQRFREVMSQRLATEMLPVVGRATKGVQLAKSFNDVAGKASALGILDQRDADLDAYVTRRTLDGLFTTMKKDEIALHTGAAN